MPKVISIDEIQEGMVSTDPIVNKYGQTLLASGVVLSDQHSLILRTWNIRTIRVNGGDDEAIAEISDELRKLILAKIKMRANWEPRNSSEEDVFSMAIQHFSKEYTTQSSEQGT